MRQADTSRDVDAALTCDFIGILSLVQMSRVHLFRNYYLGTGLITVVGTSFATLSTANAVSGVCE